MDDNDDYHHTKSKKEKVCTLIFSACQRKVAFPPYRLHNFQSKKESGLRNDTKCEVLQYCITYQSGQKRNAQGNAQGNELSRLFSDDLVTVGYNYSKKDTCSLVSWIIPVTMSCHQSGTNT